MTDDHYVALSEDTDGLLKPPTQVQRRTVAGSIAGLRRATVSLAIKIAPSQDEDHKTTFGECFLNLFKSFVGAGILALPRGFANGGIVVSDFVCLCPG